MHTTRQGLLAQLATRDLLHVAWDVLPYFVFSHARLRDQHHAGRALFVVVTVVDDRMIASMFSIARMRAVWWYLVSAWNGRIANRLATTTAK